MTTYYAGTYRIISRPYYEDQKSLPHITQVMYNDIGALVAIIDTKSEGAKISTPFRIDGEDLSSDGFPAKDEVDMFEKAHQIISVRADDSQNFFYRYYDMNGGGNFTILQKLHIWYFLRREDDWNSFEPGKQNTPSVKFSQTIPEGLSVKDILPEGFLELQKYREQAIQAEQDLINNPTP